jgi:hypothetical protein
MNHFPPEVFSLHGFHLETLGLYWFSLLQRVSRCGSFVSEVRAYFCLSFGVAQTERPARDGVYSFDASAEVREGISGWRVVDLKMDGMSTGQLQLAFGQND